VTSAVTPDQFVSCDASDVPGDAGAATAVAVVCVVAIVVVVAGAAVVALAAVTVVDVLAVLLVVSCALHETRSVMRETITNERFTMATSSNLWGE